MGGKKKWKVQDVSTHLERRAVIAGITSTEFLRQVAHSLDVSLFESPVLAKVWEWVVGFYDEHGQAPGRHIEDQFVVWAESADESVGGILQRLLESLGREWERSQSLNVPYLAGQVEGEFRRRALRKLAKEVQALAEDGDVMGAEAAIASFKPPTVGLVEGVDPFGDEDLIRRAFEDVPKPLFELPGALGEFVNDGFVREGLVGVMGPEKRGKTWLLWEIAVRALYGKNDVAFFGAGDMSEPQLIRRNAIRLAGRSDKEKYCGPLRIPVYDCKWNQLNQCERADRTCDIGIWPEGYDPDLVQEDGPKLPPLSFEEATAEGYVPCDACRLAYPDQYAGAVWWKERGPIPPLTWQQAVKLGQRFKKIVAPAELKLICYPANTLSVQKIEQHLDVWERQGFIPSVLVIDYADIMDAPGREERHRQNAIWIGLRRLSQERKLLIVTATQTDSKSYDAKLIRRRHFSEDKRKFSHATSFLTLNQTDEEKRQGVMRIGQLIAREDMYYEDETVTVLQCLEIGRPILGSFRTHHNRRRRSSVDSNEEI